MIAIPKMTETEVLLLLFEIKDPIHKVQHRYR